MLLDGKGGEPVPLSRVSTVIESIEAHGEMVNRAYGQSVVTGEYWPTDRAEFTGAGDR